ncbi:hypothetical protein DSM104443_02452 [Usitatibacter rugosus]|uniref:Fibronectin type-III domain-containing protein n=1 Tax=Usitatibacter rugosus TaxID=2732067 RepID=A0A6M4H0Q0_9PROT|nr:choice-of-anchor U domain-containing protein [Usitatibacter rugosus]QJR11377.1 hypothetical protein DSM104443_02452 [Usitatibacter rugosus]
MADIQRRIRSFLPLLVVAAAALAPSAASAADCPANNEATFLACASGPGAGDTITLSADITLGGGSPVLVVADKTLVQGAFRLFGNLNKTGAAALSINANNSLGVVQISAGTIFIGATGALGSGSLLMAGGQLVATGLANPTFSTLDFTAGTTSVISAVTGQSIGLFVTNVTLQTSSQARFGSPGRQGGVFLLPGAPSSAAADSTIVVDGTSLTAGSPNFSLLSDAAASLTIQNTGGLSNNGNNLTIANLQAPDIFAGLTIASAGASTVSVRSGNFPASIGGNGALAKIGAGTLVLSGLLQHTGGTTISGGTLQLGDGSGTNQNYNLAIQNDATLVIDTAAANFTLGGTISGSGSVVKNGVGALNLNTTSSYFGDTTINAGTLRIGNAGALGVGPNLNINTGRLQATATMTLNKNITFGAGSSPTICATDFQTLVLTGLITSNTSGVLRFNDCGAGYIELAGGTTGLPIGSLQVVNGELQVNNPFNGTLFQTAINTQVTAPGALRVNRVTPLRVANLQGDGSVIVEQSLLELSGGTFDGVISGAGGVRTVTSPVTLTGDNTYTGGTEAQINLTVGNGGASGTLGTGPINVISVVTFVRSDTLDIPNTLSGNSIQFNGGGTFILSGTGTSVGNFRTQPNATLVVTGTYLAARPQITGAGGVLRGTGIVQGFQVAPGGIVEPGVGAGTGIFNGGQPSLVGGQVSIKIGGSTAGAQYDQLQVSSFSSFSATPLSVILVGGYVPPAGTSFTIVDVATGSTPASFNGLPEGGLLATGATNFRITYQGGNGNDIVLTAISVPGAPTITGVMPADPDFPNDVQVSFTAPASDGGSPILDYTVTCAATAVMGVTSSPALLSGVASGPTTCVARARNALGNGPDSAPFAVTIGLFDFSGPSATGSGTITANVAGGGGCSFTIPPFLLPVTAAPDAPPANLDFPHGIVGLIADGCTPGSTVTFTLTFPAPLPAGTRYWVYGIEAGNPVPHWYALPLSAAVISGNTVTLSIMDDSTDDAEPTPGQVIIGGGPAAPRAAPVTPPTAGTPAYQALWWAGAQESGWGINTTHQGDILFATWFTYNANGEGQWFLMSRAERTGPGEYTGTIYTTRGPAFNAVPFDSRQVVATEVGTGTFKFSSATSGRFEYTVNGITQSKTLTRTEFGNAIPECTAGGPASAIVNYQDTWWNASESGWGLNITHQGDVIFATWFTYDTSGKAQWLLMSDVRRVGLGDSFAGKIYRARGNPFNTLPWNTGSIQVTEVGQVTLSFSDADHGTFAYTLDGVSQTKAITRQEFASPKAMCSFR